jgi:hypothetical protein
MKLRVATIPTIQTMASINKCDQNAKDLEKILLLAKQFGGFLTAVQVEEQAQIVVV